MTKRIKLDFWRKPVIGCGLLRALEVEGRWIAIPEGNFLYPLVFAVPIPSTRNQLSEYPGGPAWQSDRLYNFRWMQKVQLSTYMKILFNAITQIWRYQVHNTFYLIQWGLIKTNFLKGENYYQTSLYAISPFPQQLFRWFARQWGWCYLCSDSGDRYR